MSTYNFNLVDPKILAQQLKGIRRLKDELIHQMQLVINEIDQKETELVQWVADNNIEIAVDIKPADGCR